MAMGMYFSEDFIWLFGYDVTILNTKKKTGPSSLILGVPVCFLGQSIKNQDCPIKTRINILS